MIIIGLGFQKGVGKDYLADYLVNRHGFMKVAFADPVRAVAQTLFGFSMDQMLDPLRKEEVVPSWGFSPRQALQWIGTESFRQGFGAAAVKNGVWSEEDAANVWTRIMEKRLDRLALRWDGHRADARFVISDVRFPNEKDCIERLGGAVFKVTRPGVSDQKRDGHLSENALADLPNQAWSAVIHNTGHAGTDFLDHYLNTLYGDGEQHA